MKEQDQVLFLLNTYYAVLVIQLLFGYVNTNNSIVRECDIYIYDIQLYIYYTLL